MKGVKRSSMGPAMLAALLAAVMSLGGCGKDSSRTAPAQQQGVSEVIQEQARGNEASKPEGGSFVGDDGSSYDSVDYDLTSMSSDMVYATVYDMVSDPDAYAGRVVRMRGPYCHTFYEPTDTDYFYVVIQDATACCA